MTALAEPTRKHTDRKDRVIYSSKGLTAKGRDLAHIEIELSLAATIAQMDTIQKALDKASAKRPPAKASVNGRAGQQSRVQKALEEAAVKLLSEAFATEFTGVVDQYRIMLRESLPQGDDLALKAALNKARLQERILAATPMADQAQACELLGQSGTNPSATMKRKEERGEVLRFLVDGRPAYPLLQFDVERRRLYPAMVDLIAAKPENWSDFRLLHWLTRPHYDFAGTPAQALGSAPSDVIAAFGREIEPVVHG